MKGGPGVERIAPLRVLEYVQICAGLPLWRCGDAMKDAINRRKTVIYAIHRRVVQKGVTVAVACDELRTVCRKQGQPMSVSAMATALTNKATCAQLGIDVEVSPSVYEKDRTGPCLSRCHPAKS